MQTYWTLVKRELGAFFFSWTGYVLIATVVLLLGLSFTSMIEALNNKPTDRPVTEVFYSTAFFWFILLPAAPIMTMRAFAQEKFTGTFETLMTAPVSDFQVVLAKFTGALLFYLLSWLPLLVCLLIVRHYSDDPSALDAGTVGATYLGIFLLGALYIAVGCFASSVTRSQMIAYMISFAMGGSLFCLSFLSMAFSSQTGWRGQIMAHLGLIDQMDDFAGGVVDTRPLVLYLSLTVFFLFLTMKVVESRRWK
jgi:gliding motility-associated transport system permease protein